GTVLVKDIRPGSGNSYPYFLTNFEGQLLFRADDGVHGQELWSSDGTEAGTVLFQDLFPGSTGLAPANLTNINGTLFFTANDGLRGIELWLLNHSPTDLALSSTNLAENSAVGSVVGTFASSDPDTVPQTFTYALAAGAGDADNASFTVV